MVRSVLTLEQVLALSPDAGAALWLVRLDASDDPIDDALFQQWLDADPAHGLAWARACAIWENFGDADPADIETLKEGEDTTRWRWPRWGIAAAASVAFVAMVGVLLLISGIGPRFGLGSAPSQIAGTQPESRKILSTQDERRTVKLADGSTVTLNTGTALALTFDPAQRRLELLRGQAFFVVVHDPKRPFVVEQGKRSVTAVGTQFEMRVQDTALRVILVEGRVRVATGTGGADDIVELRAGQQLDADPSGIRVSRGDVSGVAGWQRGMVSFHDTALGEAVAEFNSHSRGKPLLVRDPRVARIQISGAFHVDDSARFARTIAEIYPVRVVETATAWEIVWKGRAGR
jgi:transmembrane sensor